MDQLFGAYLALTLACTLYVIFGFLCRHYGCTTKRKRKAAWIAAFLCVLFLYWIQNEYRHRYSPEAKAMILFDNLVNRWERGQKEYVLVYLDSLANAERPWGDLHTRETIKR